MKFFLLLILSVAVAQNSSAQEFAPPVSPEMPAAPQEQVTGLNFSKQIKLGGEVMSYRYVEPGLIEHSGFLYGVDAQFNWTLTDAIRGVVDSSFVAGKLNYDGALCDVQTYACTDYSAKTNDVIFRITHRFDFKLSDHFSIFFGPGFRYLFDRGESAGFYTRLGTYFFAPVGMTFQLPLSAGQSQLFLDLEYDLFISGTMESKVSEVNSKWDDMTHNQSAGSGHKVTAGYEFNKHLANPVQIALFYETWQIAASSKERLYINGQPSGSTYVEPKNFSESFGFKASVTF